MPPFPRTPNPDHKGTNTIGREVREEIAGVCPVELVQQTSDTTSPAYFLGLPASNCWVPSSPSTVPTFHRIHARHQIPYLIKDAGGACIRVKVGTVQTVNFEVSSVCYKSPPEPNKKESGGDL